MNIKSLNEIRKLKIDFLNNPLTILSWVQGAGKTWKALTYANEYLEREENSRIIYLSERHNNLYEKEDFLEGHKLIHWEGFKKKCPKINGVKSKLSSMKVPLKLICNNHCDMDIKDCPYWRQFVEAKRLRHGVIMAPNNYLTTDLSSYKPAWIIIDEKILTFDEYKRMEDFTKIKEYSSELYKKGEKGTFKDKELKNHISEAVKANDYELIESLTRLREHKYFLQYKQGLRDVTYKPHLWYVFDLIFCIRGIRKKDIQTLIVDR